MCVCWGVLDSPFFPYVPEELGNGLKRESVWETLKGKLRTKEVIRELFGEFWGKVRVIKKSP